MSPKHDIKLYQQHNFRITFKSVKLTKFSKTTITYSIVIIFNELPENSEGVIGRGS